MNLSSSQTRKVLSVSQLTTRIKSLLEKSFPFVWITGEISNFSVPTSGHFYFTLKDSRAQISAVMFKGQNRTLKFRPEQGMQVLGFGRVSLYEPRGAYQIILEYLEPEGVGALQIAFEQLKNRLSEEGLFRDDIKKPLPALPHRLSVITSPTGAVVHDILTVLGRRFPNLAIDILPVKVQGFDAADEIVKAFEILNHIGTSEVVILARGGGSLEDLQAFNEERVARAIHACPIPVISAVGHETDFTIADFTADLRAPTPSAAAELAVPVKTELTEQIVYYQTTLQKEMNGLLEDRREQVQLLRGRLKDPGRIIQDARLKVDDYTERIHRVLAGRLQLAREKIARRRDNLMGFNPQQRLFEYKEKLEQIKRNIQLYLNISLDNKRSRHLAAAASLKALDPQATLQRGYSITRTGVNGRIVMDPAAAPAGRLLEITVAGGQLNARVEKEKTDG